jgi:hypothetical protein
MVAMVLRVFQRSKRKKPAPRPADSERLMRIYWATHDDVRDVVREPSRREAA